MSSTEAAKKAWVTRKTNQRKRSEAAVKANESRTPEERSEASRKAWRTRNFNSLKAKRSAAAKKAWETRRQTA